MANCTLKCSISSDNTKILTIPGLSQVPGFLRIIFLGHNWVMLQKRKSNVLELKKCPSLLDSSDSVSAHARPNSAECPQRA